jgi:DNA transformation protein and related proteins
MAGKTSPADLKGLAALPSLGKTSAEMLIEAGIATPDQLRKVGAEEAYRRLRFAHGKRVTINFIYALECAVLGLRWRDLGKRRQVRLRAVARSIQAEIDVRRGA